MFRHSDIIACNCDAPAHTRAAVSATYCRHKYMFLSSGVFRAVSLHFCSVVFSRWVPLHLVFVSLFPPFPPSPFSSSLDISLSLSLSLPIYLSHCAYPPVTCLTSRRRISTFVSVCAPRWPFDRCSVPKHSYVFCFSHCMITKTK